MRKNLVFIYCLLSNLFIVHAQPTLYGTTLNGGTNSTGTIFYYQPATNIQHIIKNLDSYLGSPTDNNFIQASDGKLYSMTTYGGVYGYGAIFSFDPTTDVYIDVHDFNYAGGAYPYGSLIQLANGED